MATFKITTVEKTINVEDDDLMGLWNEWKDTPERSGRERAAWERIIDRASELAEVEESEIDYVVDVDLCAS